MSWACLRKATEEDHNRLQTTAERFAARHDMWIFADIVGALEVSLNIAEYRPELKRLWLACVRRALRDKRAEGIAYGYVGRNIT